MWRHLTFDRQGAWDASASRQLDVGCTNALEVLFLEERRVDIRSRTSQRPQLAEYTGPTLVHSVRDLSTHQPTPDALNNAEPLNASPRLDLRVAPYPRDAPEPARVGGGEGALGDEQRAGDDCALGVVLRGVNARDVLGVGAEAREGREYEPVREDVLPDDGRLEELGDGGCRGGHDARLRGCGGKC